MYRNHPLRLLGRGVVNAFLWLPKRGIIIFQKLVLIPIMALLSGSMKIWSALLCVCLCVPTVVMDHVGDASFSGSGVIGELFHDQYLPLIIVIMLVL